MTLSMVQRMLQNSLKRNSDLRRCLVLNFSAMSDMVHRQRVPASLSSICATTIVKWFPTWIPRDHKSRRKTPIEVTQEAWTAYVIARFYI
jgi:hypothetical protein